MNHFEEASNNGIGFGGLLFLVFLTLKLTGYIDWSWWWIFAPFWAPIALVALIFFLILTVTLIKEW